MRDGRWADMGTLCTYRYQNGKFYEMILKPMTAADCGNARLPAVRLIEPDLFGQFCHRAYLLPISRWLSVAA